MPGLVVGQADGGGRLVDVLPTRAAGMEDVLAIVVRLQIDFHVLRLRQHGDGGGGGVDPSLGLGFGDPLHAVAAAFIPQLPVHPLPVQAQRDFLEPAQLRGADPQHLHLPALAFRMALVHFEQVAGEQGGFLAARAGADLHDAAAAIGIVAADRQVQQFVPQLLPLLLHRGSSAAAISRSSGSSL